MLLRRKQDHILLDALRTLFTGTVFYLALG
jgi:hypothetical protein